MLVISRKTSESIMIGGDIEIVVTEIGSERVKLGINAPKGVPILRRELLETREMNREAAAGAVGKDAVDALQRLLSAGAPPAQPVSAGPGPDESQRPSAPGQPETTPEGRASPSGPEKK